MPTDRGAQHHRERLQDALRDEISAILEGELADPRIGLATVSDVQLSPDGKTVHVLVASPGTTDEEARNTMEGLNAARGYIRHEVADRLRLRHAPELFFRLDRSEEIGARIDELLNRVKKRSK